ncbi:hypothetical protein ACP6JB_008320, partial [Aspergillus fumigatus]
LALKRRDLIIRVPPGPLAVKRVRYVPVDEQSDDDAEWIGDGRQDVVAHGVVVLRPAFAALRHERIS